MTNQTPPVSPDFATPPKELVERAKAWLHNPQPHDFDDDVLSLAHELLAAEERGASRERERCDEQCFALGREIEALRKDATLSHAAGRAEGLTEAAKWHEARLRGYMGGAFHRFSADAIRALASDPVAGDQARNVTAEDVAMFDAALGKSVTVVDEGPAPAPGLAAQEVERLRAIHAAARDAARLLSYPIDQNVVKAAQILNAALSAPRPAQAKEGPTE